MGITDFLLAFAVHAAVSVETVAVVVAGCILAKKAYYSIVALGVVQMQQQSISWIFLFKIGGYLNWMTVENVVLLG